MKYTSATHAHLVHDATDTDHHRQNGNTNSSVFKCWFKKNTHNKLEHKLTEELCLLYSIPSVWNFLPYEIRHIHSAAAFKTLKTHLFKSYLC